LSKEGKVTTSFLKDLRKINPLHLPTSGGALQLHRFLSFFLYARFNLAKLRFFFCPDYQSASFFSAALSS
jgi:hypothetical protein